MCRYARELVLVAVLAAAFACTHAPFDLNGWHCNHGACADGFVCHPETDMCVPPVLVSCSGASDAYCPSTTSTGDACASAGSFLPCDDTIMDCTYGCRTCSTELTWSACTPSLAPVA